MKNIKELVGLAQMISAVMDETGVNFLDVDMCAYDRARFSVSPEFFFKNFNGFKIEMLGENRDFKFRLTKDIQGVEFSTLVNNLDGFKIVRELSVKRNKKSLRALACE